MALSICDAEKWRPLWARDSWPSEEPQRSPLCGSDAPVATELRQRPRWLTDADVTRLVARYAEGATTYELAAEIGCSRSNVVATLRRAGVELDGSRRLRLDVGLLAQITELHSLGPPIREIARRTGFSHSKVDRYLQVGLA